MLTPSLSTTVGITMMLMMISSLLFDSAHSALVGPIVIKENGQTMTRYVVSTWPGGARVNGSAVFLQHNDQVQIAKISSSNYDPNMFMEYKLNGKTLSFTTDLSRIGCSCNAALYFSSMPGYGSNGQPNPTKSGDYYCDANQVGGTWCWEMDVMEANKFVTQVTPHQCNNNAGTYTTWCDRGGCATNGHDVDGMGMCPSSSCKINTQRPFRYSVTFGSTIDVKLTQGGNTFSFQSCNNQGYIERMQQPFEYGMTMVMSYWGNTYQTMSWLDGKTGCGGDCDTSGVAIFSDIQIDA